MPAFRKDALIFVKQENEENWLQHTINLSRAAFLPPPKALGIRSHLIHIIAGTFSFLFVSVWCVKHFY